MSRQVIKASTALDRKGYKLVVDLYGGEYSGNIVDESHPGLRYATEVVRVLGPQYSYCYIGVPVNEFGAEWAPAVALQQDGPAGKVKLRSRARVNMVDYNDKSIPLLVGSITQYAHNIDEDSVVGMVMDDRWLLSKVTCFGAAKFDPVSGKSYFDAGRPLMFNWMGYPDCLDCNGGPLFAPGHLYGWKRSESIEDSKEPSKGSAKTQSRSWTCADIVMYLRNLYYSHKRPSHSMDYGKDQLSQFIDWPASLGSQYGFDRPARNFSCENLDVAEALGRVCKKAGPYELQCNPVGWRGQLGIVQVNSRVGGTYLTGPTYGSSVLGGNITDALEDYTRVSGGTVMESIVGYFDDVCIAGDGPAVEHEFAGFSEDDQIPVELENAWTVEDEDAFKKIVKDKGANADSFEMACKQYPMVYSTFRVVPYWFAYEKTLFSDVPTTCSPRILPRLLSGYAEGNSNPRNFNPRDIIIEYYDPTGYPLAWKPCSRYDNLEIVNDGTAFRVSALRDQSNPVTFHSSGYDVATMGANYLRLTCAVEREFRITGKSKGDPNNTSNRVAYAGQRFTFLSVAEDGDYVHLERYASCPNGNSGDPDENALFPDKCDKISGDKYLFSDLEDTRGGKPRIKRHADHRLEDVKRIDYHGILTMHTWNPSLRPGMQVMLDCGRKPIVPKAVIRMVKFNSQTQAMEVELVAGDNSVIYSVPLPVVHQTSGGSPQPTGTAGPSTAPAIGTTDQPKKSEEVITSGKDQAQSAGSSTSSSGSSSAGAKYGPPDVGTPEQEAAKDLLWAMGSSEQPSDSSEKAGVQSSRIGGSRINTPEDKGGAQGWNRMKNEENYSQAGIYYQESLKQKSHDEVKNQRRAEGLTREERLEKTGGVSAATEKKQEAIQAERKKQAQSGRDADE